VLNIFRIRKTLKYIFLATITAINFEVFIAYSNEEQYEITELFEGGMLAIMTFLTTVLLILYNSSFSKIGTKYFTLLALIARIIS